MATAHSVPFVPMSWLISGNSGNNGKVKQQHTPCPLYRCRGFSNQKATRTRGCVNFTKLIVHKSRGHSETVDTLTERKKTPKRTNKGARGMKKYAKVIYVGGKCDKKP